ncbi:hypothetical protein [Streptomyces sp. NPDC056387]|uniref:hypothetical protein n=1 Tax=Streptomyces sp. NPDC056387 TaxID=3345803 RepID=UPI0035E2B00E
MRLYSTAYLAYGIQIPDTDIDRLEEVLQGIDGVGYLTAGRFGDERTYLTTECYSADAGEYRAFAPETLERRPEQAAWDASLKAAAEALGRTEAVMPRWFITADLDN